MHSGLTAGRRCAGASELARVLTHAHEARLRLQTVRVGLARLRGFRHAGLYDVLTRLWAWVKMKFVTMTWELLFIHFVRGINSQIC